MLNPCNFLVNEDIYCKWKLHRRKKGDCSRTVESGVETGNIKKAEEHCFSMMTENSRIDGQWLICQNNAHQHEDKEMCRIKGAPKPCGQPNRLESPKCAEGKQPYEKRTERTVHADDVRIIHPNENI